MKHQSIEDFAATPGARGAKGPVAIVMAEDEVELSGTLERRPGLRLALQNQDVPPVDGVPLCGRELMALTGATSDGLPPWLAGLGMALSSLGVVLNALRLGGARA